ncbi:DNA-binding response OmpR family regulator [Panacagrimonas perspica]|uniref:DNA-binding response OmpR family regulator n=1 Tax=Panacagrimonas perspica TaxID=381431 RepID=A0A4S3K1A2_9GAMM|nr:response regulator transcription factor [Panacagrimonas perspica]TDU23348.1 DNA-binding response OmpR family regulator [Panacagrimonas perspica]THD01504.1 DNA-binding response regulator [Panacagrimonas perspica]
MKVRVLVIEDDDDLRDTLCRYLTGIGMEVHDLDRAEKLDEHLAQHPVDLLVCDVNLPGESGFSIVARLRQISRAGVIMLTGRGQDEDRMLGLSLGADHYLLKPVNLRELEFVIRNLHRRLSEAPAVEPDPPAQGVWKFDAKVWALTAPNGKPAQLTMSEYRLLQCLVTRAGDVTTREQLLAAMDRPNLEIYSRNLDVTVSRLRKKVEDACGQKLPISSARGIGYVFNGRGEMVG